MSITLSPDQQAVFSPLLTWIEKPPEQYTTLGGLAGTGKTTIIKKLIEEVGKHTAVMALAGKAVHVLRRKGVPWAQTIHSTIYDSFPNGDGTFTHRLKNKLEYDLLIVDEASMVSRELFDALLSFGIPVLFVGDHGQLEPIGDNPCLMENPVYKLETIHRQALGSPIIALAHRLREGEQPLVSSESNEQGSVKVAPEAELEVDLDWQVIVPFNKARHNINRHFREYQGFTGDLPYVGDRLICLKNNRKVGIFNGQMFRVVEVGAVDRALIDITVKDEDSERTYEVEAVVEQFGSSKPDIQAPMRGTYFDYAYAITAHKAQGSEFPKVAVFDCGDTNLWSTARWRYTAATRASEHLAIYV